MRHDQIARIVLVLMFASAAACLSACAAPAPPPATCAEAIERANSDPRLRIQGGSEDAVNSREIAKVRLYRARMAAAAGDEATCRREVGSIYLR